MSLRPKKPRSFLQEGWWRRSGSQEPNVSLQTRLRNIIRVFLHTAFEFGFVGARICPA